MTRLQGLWDQSGCEVDHPRDSKLFANIAASDRLIWGKQGRNKEVSRWATRKTEHWLKKRSIDGWTVSQLGKNDSHSVRPFSVPKHSRRSKQIPKCQLSNQSSKLRKLQLKPTTNTKTTRNCTTRTQLRKNQASLFRPHSRRSLMFLPNPQTLIKSSFRRQSKRKCFTCKIQALTRRFRLTFK